MLLGRIWVRRIDQIRQKLTIRPRMSSVIRLKVLPRTCLIDIVTSEAPLFAPQRTGPYDYAHGVFV